MRFLTSLDFFDALRRSRIVFQFELFRFTAGTCTKLYSIDFTWGSAGLCTKLVLLSTILQLHFPTDSELEEEQGLLQLASNLQKHRKSWAQLVTRKVFFLLGSFSPMHEQRNSSETERGRDRIAQGKKCNVTTCSQSEAVIRHYGLSKSICFVFPFLLYSEACFATPNTQTRHKAR